MGEFEIALIVFALNACVLGTVFVAAYVLNKSARTQFTNRTRGE
jgi:hypothetical protein